MSKNDLNAFLDQRVEETTPTELNPKRIKHHVRLSSIP